MADLRTKPPRPPPLPREPFAPVRDLRDTQPLPLGRPAPEIEQEPPPTGPYELAYLIRGLRHDLVLLREEIGSLTPPQAPAVPLTPVPPSKRQAAALAVGNVAKYTTLAVGVLGLAAQVAAMFKPGLVGPIQTLIELVRGLGGAP